MADFSKLLVSTLGIVIIFLGLYNADSKNFPGKFKPVWVKPKPTVAIQRPVSNPSFQKPKAQEGAFSLGDQISQFSSSGQAEKSPSLLSKPMNKIQNYIPPNARPNIFKGNMNKDNWKDESNLVKGKGKDLTKKITDTNFLPKLTSTVIITFISALGSCLSIVYLICKTVLLRASRPPHDRRGRDFEMRPCRRYHRDSRRGTYGETV